VPSRIVHAHRRFKDKRPAIRLANPSSYRVSGETTAAVNATAASPDDEARNEPSSLSVAPSSSPSGISSRDENAIYTDRGADHFTRHINPDSKRRNHVRQFEALGYTVTLTPAERPT
jgi:hypothetical protein